MPTQAERIAKVETRLDALGPKVDEIHADVKTLLAAHNRQKGFVTIGKAIWGGAIALGTLVTDYAFTHWHHN